MTKITKSQIPPIGVTDRVHKANYRAIQLNKARQQCWQYFQEAIGILERKSKDHRLVPQELQLLMLLREAVGIMNTLEAPSQQLLVLMQDILHKAQR
jgi:hypothetical protein